LGKESSVWWTGPTGTLYSHRMPFRLADFFPDGATFVFELQHRESGAFTAYRHGGQKFDEMFGFLTDLEVP